MIPWEHKISTIYVKRLFAYDTYKKNTLHFTCLSILKSITPFDFFASSGLSTLCHTSDFTNVPISRYEVPCSL